ncbi:MAG TPA: class I SAM-dependent methyltransferase [Candidatus Krumholzibacteria bacterium]|nr:class I SAM-dependent methyltransferase [Candidatus Krumholzibacteria bacterium]
MTGLIVALNRVFRRPNVGGRESAEAYSDWERTWGKEFARMYMEPAADLRGKHLLDVGCGLGGKTVAYAETGAVVTGADLLEKNVEQSGAYAKMKGARADFFVADAAALPLREGAFDTVVANDAMEHFAEPADALREMARVVKPGGAIWIFFTPHYSPLGSHLYDYIYTPWCHLLFTRGQLQSAIRAVLRQRLKGASHDEIEGRVREIMESYDRDLNHMSVSKFLGIVRAVRELRISRLELKPAKFSVFKPLTRVPGVRELFSGFVVCRLERV